MSQTKTLIGRTLHLSNCIAETNVSVRASPACSMQDPLSRQFVEHMPPVKYTFEFEPERSGRNPMRIEGLLVLTFPSQQMKVEFTFHSGWRQDTVAKTVEAYRMNGNRQMMNMLQFLLSTDLSVKAREEILDVYFEYIMGYTQAQLKTF
jgi:hypothetical protein